MSNNNSYLDVLIEHKDVIPKDVYEILLHKAILIHDRLLTTKEVMNRLDISRTTLWRYIKDGHLQSISLPGQHIRIRESDLDSFIRRNTVKVFQEEDTSLDFFFKPEDIKHLEAVAKSQMTV